MVPLTEGASNPSQPSARDLEDGEGQPSLEDDDHFPRHADEVRAWLSSSKAGAVAIVSSERASEKGSAALTGFVADAVACGCQLLHPTREVTLASLAAVTVDEALDECTETPADQQREDESHEHGGDADAA